MKQETNDLKIMGQMTLSGGRYQDVVVMGELTVNGDLECRDMKIMGQTHIRGGLKGRSGKVNGKAVLDGAMDMEALKVQGQVKTRKPAKIGILDLKGQIQIDGGLQSEEVNVWGELHVGGDCTAERFTSKGAFTVEGLLNADEIGIKLYGPSRAKEVGGGRITVRRAPASMLGHFLKSLFMGGGLQHKLSAESIEGDDIYLEYTSAKVVRGNNVTLGKECAIELVEYRKNFEPASDAKIGNSRKV